MESEKKIKKPQLSVESLNLHLEQLTSLLNQPWLFSPSFKQLRETIDALADAFNTYRAYLKQQSNAYAINQASLTPARIISESIKLVSVEVVSQCSSQYADIQTALSTSLCTLLCLQRFCPRRSSPTIKLVCWFEVGILKHDV